MRVRPQASIRAGLALVRLSGSIDDVFDQPDGAFMIHRYSTFTILTALALPALAEEHAVQPIYSDPYEVSDARVAMDEVMALDDAADKAAQDLLMSGEVDLATFVPSQPMYQRVSWHNDRCTDLVSLFPSPPEGWVIASDWGQYENPISEERGELFYVKPPDLPIDDPAFVSETKTASVRIIADSPLAQMWEMGMENEAMRDAIFEVRPFGYPTMRMQTATMVSDFHVDVTGTGEDTALMFLEIILACAIDSGTLADGVDPATLTR